MQLQKPFPLSQQRNWICLGLPVPQTGKSQLCNPKTRPFPRFTAITVEVILLGKSFLWDESQITVTIADIYFPHISPKTGGRKSEDLFNFLASLFHGGLLDVVSTEHAITR